VIPQGLPGAWFLSVCKFQPLPSPDLLNQLAGDRALAADERTNYCFKLAKMLAR